MFWWRNGKKGGRPFGRTQGFLSQNWGRNEPIQSVTFMGLKDSVNDRRTIVSFAIINYVTSSGCFYPRSNHWEKLEEGRSVTSVAAEFGIAHSIVSRLWRQFQTTGTAIRGFISGRPRGTIPADDRYIVLQTRRNRWQAAGEIATQATGRPISRFTVARRLHGGGLFARRPVPCVPLTPAHRRRRSLWCREHRN
ncbi:transposable element Tcb2 transposase [Trichonephila clavipes]|nr:transposable element Tcb2 transposase [Trichonephila clavipes]